MIAIGQATGFVVGMKDYSQNGEQAIILNYFGDRKGVFLDIGANDGVTFSNARALNELGWKGVLVEPSPSAYKKLGENYWPPVGGAVYLIPAAITTADGPIDLYDSGTHLKKGDVALLSTTVPKEMDRWKKSGEQFTKTSVRGITFETLMKETGHTHFDMISIDVEGADLDVLRQIDLTAVGCQLLCIECNQRKDDERAVDEYCRKHGMKLLARSYENLIYARQ